MARKKKFILKFSSGWIPFNVERTTTKNDGYIFICLVREEWDNLGQWEGSNTPVRDTRDRETQNVIHLSISISHHSNGKRAKMKKKLNKGSQIK